jgi:hypothetical protein
MPIARPDASLSRWPVATALALAVAGAAGTALAAPGLTGMWLIDRKDFPQTDFVSAPPYRPEAMARFRAEEKAVDAGKVISDEGRLCLPIGMPGFMENEFALEIVESADRIIMLNEASSLPRSIYLNRTSHQLDIEPLWNGHSIGHWEGQTLVVDTADLNDRIGHIAFGASGPRSDSTHIVERIHLENGGQTLVDEITVEDPKLLTRPFVSVKHFKRLPADSQLWENVCEVNAPGWSERFKGDPQAKPVPIAAQ